MTFSEIKYERVDIQALKDQIASIIFHSRYDLVLPWRDLLCSQIFKFL